MTKSRKLIIALVLLAGGYGLAILLSGLTDYLNPDGASPGRARSDTAGLLATLKEFVPHHSQPTQGRLVPESNDVVHQVQPSQSAAEQWNTSPTWLAQTPVANSDPPPVGRAEFAAAPALANDRPPEPAPIVPSEAVELMPRPVARITNVVAANGSSASSASAWDRWPRWEPAVGKSQGVVVATNFPGLEPVKPPASQAVLDHADARRETRQEAEAIDANKLRGRTHFVVDGDSLAKLADRYLDDATLADEIFRLNRDVLSDPEVLPIGVELRIPDSRLADSAAISSVARTVEAAKPSLPAGMVPVERTPRSFDTTPRPQLMQPIAPGRSG